MSLSVLHEFTLSSEDETTQLARDVGGCLSSGDTLLLHGHIGAGKTFFARRLIQSLQETPEDIPSPTFTLVQTYDTRLGELWHADLYRLSGPDELFEIGLTDAMGDAICLIEWPDKLSGIEPRNSLNITFEALDVQMDNRRVVLSSLHKSGWEKKLRFSHV